MEREVLINLVPKTDFEKLLFAENYIKQLKDCLRNERIEKGKLQSELDEAKYMINELHKKIHSLNINNKAIIERVEIKKYIKTIKELRTNNRELINKLCVKK